MKPFKNLLKGYLLSSLIIIMIAGCGDDDETTTGPYPGDVIVLSGTITKDTTLTSDYEYLLIGGVFVGNDINETVLTIEPGTKIYGEYSTKGMLFIRRNSKIIIEGNTSEPIVMTSDKAECSRGRSDWGGLIINGKAPLNTGSEAYGEGGTGYYVGTDTHDNSGTLKYVRVEFAGREISPDNELNGIALQGVGDGTTVNMYRYTRIKMMESNFSVEPLIANMFISRVLQMIVLTTQMDGRVKLSS